MEDLSIYSQADLLYTQESFSRYRPGGYHPVNLGDTFKDNRYEVHHKLGWGEFSTVWLAYDKEQKIWVSLKIKTADSSLESREHDCMQVLQKNCQGNLSSKYIVQLLDFFLHHGPNGTHQCLVFELLGPPVHKVLREYDDSQERLETDIILRMSRQLLESIDFIHSVGIGHGDISSRNMVFSCNNLSTVTQEYLFQVLGAPVSEQLTRLDGGQLSEGLPKSLVKAAEWIGWIDEDEDLRLFDFGDSLFQGKEPAKPAHLGSLRAPETIFEKSFDYRIDLWHAGCMIYSFIFGSVPFWYLGDDELLVTKMIDLLGKLPSEWQPQWGWMKKESKSELDLNEDRQPTLLTRKFNETVLNPKLRILRTVIEQLMEFLPSNRAAASAVLSLMSSNVGQIPDSDSGFKLTCVALYNASEISETPSVKSGLPNNLHTIGPNYFKSAEWTPDGTSVITMSADNHIRTFILPPDLLEQRETPLDLKPYSTLPSMEPVHTTAIYPFFNLQDPSTTLILSSVRDHPIRLSSALSPQNLGTYSLINPSTEAFIAPHSILYPSHLGGSQFITGSDSLICIFDVSRTGNNGPVSRLPTIPSKRKQIVGGGVGMKGIVSALAMNPAQDGILAAGTFTRNIALYGARGSGELIGTFSIAKTEADSHIGGTGITQLLWSPCGRYLYVVERKSQGTLVYDIRVTGQLLGWLEGREAMSNQRMNVDVIAADGEDSHEVWAGGTDGIVRMWKNPHTTVGGHQPDFSSKIHDDPITSSVFHPGGSVLATCSGQKRFPEYDVDDIGKVQPKSEIRGDDSLKIWAL
ncbi:hypothetical protein EYB25_000326 [Talaromyces marneffei]|uniref:uncharacterized protein n=1 Tax=Talaromyces marneffei TaxID=37727 RepID=UPI0012A7D921|nr:uncharacterized protein EYB26_002027 [Talaromyces marneffei]KAE8555628.1 hypothetical protein EYB25_000326 [Talaromyces marneffei]QGA14374.1 hypothetical protein EYB26_002027 [Talaromyces marneffei]